MSLASGIISYYKFDENTGNTVHDSTGINNATWNGTLGSQWTTGKINSGGSFNGTNNEVSTNLWLASAPNPISMTAWFQTNNYQTQNQAIMINGQDTGGGSRGTGLYIGGNNNSSGTIYILDAVIAWHSCGFNVTDSNWHHICLTIDLSGNVAVYLDGVSRFTSGSLGLNTPNTAAYIGGDGGGYWFPGLIDEVGIWNRPLLSSEAYQLYNSGLGLQYPFTTYRVGFAGNKAHQPIGVTTITQF